MARPRRPLSKPPPWSEMLRALRDARGVTQDGWATWLGVSRTTVQRWETGEAVPNLHAEAALETVLRERGLFRAYDQGPLRGLTVTPEFLRDLLAEARLAASPADARDGETSRDPPADAAEPAASLPPRPDTNLPPAATSFVGRGAERADILRLLDSSRLLTLAGAGGVGKTRLAAEVVAGVPGRYRDGVHLIELAPLADPALVPGAVAAAAGVREEPGRGLVETLADALGDRELLLVLDNCEHLREAAGALARALLRACPRLRILATSRAALGIVGETVWRVPPLSVPEPEEPPGGGAPGHTAASVLRAEAAQLFRDRAVAAFAVFAVTDDNAAAVAAICRRLDGLPLAIELAAARARILTPAQIAAHLDERFRLLGGGSRDAPTRQQTLRAALDWSHDLLDGPERALLRRLSAFAGGCEIEAVEAVCVDETVTRDALFDLLAGLVEQSLVTVEYRGEAARYRLLETVRQYAAERLDEAGEVDEVGTRLRGWALALLDLASPRLRGPDQAAWLDRIDAEHDTVRAVLGDAVATGRFAEGLRLAGRMGGFWSMRGLWSEGRHWFERLLPHAAAAPAGVRALALLRAGKLAEQQGAYDEATPLVQQSLDLFQEVEDREQEFHATSLLGMLAWRRSDLAVSAAYHEAALALAREIGNGTLISSSLNNLAVLAVDGSRLEAARDYLEEALGLARDAGDAAGIAMRLDNLAMLAIRMGDLSLARTYAEEALALDRRNGVAAMLPNHLRRLAEIYLGQGDTGAARRHAEEALAAARGRGDQFEMAEALDHLARIAVERSALREAEAHTRDGLRIAANLGTQRQIWLAIQRLGEIARREGDWRRAVMLYGAADAIRAATGEVQPEGTEREIDAYLEGLRVEQGDVAIGAAWAAGAAMSTEQAIDHALAGLPVEAER